jgi:hypothetical protein
MTAKGCGWWLVLLLAVAGLACCRASRISIVNDVGTESDAAAAPIGQAGPSRLPAIDYPWAGFRSLFSVSGFQQAANDLRSIVENAISNIRISEIVRHPPPLPSPSSDSQRQRAV